MKYRAIALAAGLGVVWLTTWVVGFVVGQQTGQAPQELQVPTLPQTLPQGAPQQNLVVPPSPTTTLPTLPDTAPSVPLPQGTQVSQPQGTQPQVSQPAVPATVDFPSQPASRFSTEMPIEKDSEATQSNSNPTGRQEPSVSLEWIGPPTAKLNQSVTYQIIVKNISSCPVHNVVVRNRFPAGINIQATEPKAFGDNGVWELGTLASRQEKRIDIQLLPETKGDLACQATVTFTGASIARLRVREPKLALKVQAPDKVLMGDTVSISVTVNNPGDGTADQVKLRCQLPEGLDHPRGKTVDFDLGSLGPNENRSVQLACLTKAAGEQKVDVIAVADGGLTARESANINVVMPQLDLVVNGPRLRYLDRHATYTFKVTNPGSAPASNVNITEQIPPGFKFLAASQGGRHDFSSRTVSWFIGDIGPAQSHEVSMEVVAVNTGEFKHVIVASAARGIHTEGNVVTRVEGLPALLMELVDLDDPVEVGADTAYEIRVTNTGSKTETNLQLICTVPEKMEFRGAIGAAGCRFRTQGKDVIFEPLPKLAPRADAIYRVNVRGVSPGDLRFRARITSDGLVEPVLKEESTKVYGDEALPGKGMHD